MLSDWTNPPRLVEKLAEQGSRIPGNTGKSVDGERDSAGFVVAMKRSNVRGGQEALLFCNGSNKMEGKGEMTKAPISLQDPRGADMSRRRRNRLGVLGTICPRMQDGNFAGSLPDGEKEMMRGTGH